MPDDVAAARDLYLTAIANSVLAGDAADAADTEMTEAHARYNAASEEYEAACRAETAALERYKTALRDHGMVDTASGPVTADSLHYGTSALPHKVSDCAPDRCGSSL